MVCFNNFFCVISSMRGFKFDSFKKYFRFALIAILWMILDKLCKGGRAQSKLLIPGQRWRRVLQSDNTPISVSAAVSTSVREKSDFGSNAAHSVLVVSHDGSRRSGFVRDFLQQKFGSIQTAGGPGRRFPAQGIETLKQIINKLFKLSSLLRFFVLLFFLVFAIAWSSLQEDHCNSY